jgi:hypothetical protein
MERTSSTTYVWSALFTLVASLFLALSAYVGGYFMLPDSEGRYPNRAIFKMYEPALRLQRSATGEPVTAGYVDPQGRRRLLRLR